MPKWSVILSLIIFLPIMASADNETLTILYSGQTSGKINPCIL